jgi:hypothetical protein
VGDISELSLSGVEKVSDHGTQYWSQKMFWVPRKYFPKKEKNCNNLDNKRNSEENSHHDLRNAIISATILIVW